MKGISGKRSQRELDQLEPAAGSGLLDRRAFLRGGGAAMAAAMSGYALTAKSEPLKDDPWSLQAGQLHSRRTPVCRSPWTRARPATVENIRDYQLRGGSNSVL